MRPKRTCSADGCSEGVHGNGYCSKHYKRWRKTGTTELPPNPSCAVKDCPDLAAPGRRGFCGKHYTRWHRYGDPLATAVIVGDDEARFWSKVSKDGPVPEHCPELGSCWPWTGGCDEAGYGVFYVTQGGGLPRKTRAHRWLLGHLRGTPLAREIVGEEDGCHHCDNPPCCNPDHLYIGTRKQNIGDAVQRNRLRQQQVTHCPMGHEYTYNPSGRHRRCKTCEQEAQRITRTVNRRTCKNGHPLEGDNILLCKNGTRKCRTCDEARVAAMLERKAR